MKRGFSLLECLIYLSLMMIASLMISTMCTRFFESVNGRVTRSAQNSVSLWALACYIARDIRSAPADARLWVQEASMIGWKGEKPCVWTLKENRLFRVAGKEYAAIADGLDQFTCAVGRYHDQVRSVSYTLSKQGVTLNMQVPVYEGIFVCIS